MESKDAERVEIVQVEALVKATNAVAVSGLVRQELIRTLSPVAERMAGYEKLAKTIIVADQDDADNAAKADKEIAADIKLVEGNDVLSKIIRGLDQLHGKAVAVRSLFVGPMKGYRKTIRQPVLDWEAAEKKKADDLARKLNAEAEAKAALERARQEAEAQRQRDIESAALRKAEDARRAAAEASGKERARLEAEANAADRKTAAANIKAEARTDAAASVIAPTVTIAAPKSGLRSMGVVTCEIVSITAFIKEAGKRVELCGYIDQDALGQRLKRARIQNPMFDVAGVKFGKKTV